MKIQQLLTTLALFAGIIQSASAAVTFTNTPAAVSNTYNRTITLQIGGIPTGDTVVVQKFLDANTNGVVDAGDILVQQFNLTDGQAGMVIGGVTNFNVPGDLNATTGAITATLNFQNGDFVQNIVGNYLYVLSSPAGDFAPITNSFSVTNFPFPQMITGNVVSNSTSTTLPNAIVLLFPPPRPGNKGPGGNPLAGVVANNAGSYTVQVPPGTYMPVAFEYNYVANMSTAPLLMLAASQTITTNLTLTNATASISGQVVDANNSSVGLPGVFLPTMANPGLIAATFTDTNGNYNVPVVAGQWSLGSTDLGLIVHGYVGWNNGTNVNAGSTGVALAYPQATALFYGSVKDNLGNPLVGIDVNASDSSNLYTMDGYTDTNGNFFVGVLGGLGSNDTWQVGIGSDSSPTNYIFSQPRIDQNGGTNLPVGQAVQVNFTALLATNTISGNVQDSNGTNIVGVGVSASATISNRNYQVSVDTDANGNYSFNVANATNWSVSVNCNGGSDSLSQLGTNYACPNNTNVTILNNNGVANFVVQFCGGIVFNTPSPLPVGEVNVSYNQSIQASTCSGTYIWSQSGGTLPGNLNLFPGGSFFVLSGNPTNSGTFNFTVQLNDGSNITNQQYSVTISNALQVTTISLPNGTNGSFYSQQLQASNGVPYGGVPYRWSLASGSLPANLNLATNGLLSGSLTTNGTFNFTVAAADSLGGIYDQPLSLVIATNNPPPAGLLLSAPAYNHTGSFQFDFMSAPDINYTIQYSSNLSTWISVLSFQSPGGSMLIVDPNTAGSSQRFYRVKIGP